MRLERREQYQQHEHCEQRLERQRAARSKTVDIYSDLPLTGAVTAQTVPALNGEKLALKQAGFKAGQWKVNFISLNDATATSPTNYDLNVCQANARKAATDPKAVYYVGPFNSGCAEVEIPITNTGRPRAGQSREHLPGADDQRPGHRTRRAPEVLPNGQADVPADRPSRHDPGPGRPGGDEAGGCTRVAVANDKTPYGVGLATQSS